MSNRRRADNYYKKLAVEQEKIGQKNLNIVEAMKEKLGIKTRFEVANATPYKQQTAPTEFPGNLRKAPRAYKIAYSQSDETLVVNFSDGVWKSWSGVPANVWQDLKTSSSTGKFLWNNGFDRRGPQGQLYPMSDFNPDEMDEDTRVMFNE